MPDSQMRAVLGPVLSAVGRLAWASAPPVRSARDLSGVSPVSCQLMTWRSQVFQVIFSIFASTLALARRVAQRASVMTRLSGRRHPRPGRRRGPHARADLRTGRGTGLYVSGSTVRWVEAAPADGGAGPPGRAVNRRPGMSVLTFGRPEPQAKRTPDGLRVVRVAVAIAGLQRGINLSAVLARGAGITSRRPWPWRSRRARCGDVCCCGTAGGAVDSGQGLPCSTSCSPPPSGCSRSPGARGG